MKSGYTTYSKKEYEIEEEQKVIKSLKDLYFPPEKKPNERTINGNYSFVKEIKEMEEAIRLSRIECA